MGGMFLQKANALQPRLYKKQIVAVGDYGEIKKGEVKIFDLGNHCVGKMTIQCKVLEGIPDAPVLFRFFFAERKEELATRIPPEQVEGAVSGAWLQEELVKADYIELPLKLPRRYACRYIKVECLATSFGFTFAIEKISFTETTSAKGKIPLVGKTDKQKRIDEVALRTLRGCMQEVFEDGPKRDRRLWLGDLRLQALVNYETYKNYDLVKRCLYLFAATAEENGKVCGCVFTEPYVYGGCPNMFDYSLLFPACLLEYFEATGDRETAEALFPTAAKQIELARVCFDEKGLVKGEGVGWCFIDWNDYDKCACAQAVYIYALKTLKALGEKLNADMGYLNSEIEQKTAAAIKAFYDEEQGLVVQKNGEAVYMDNVWFCLAEIFPKNVCAEVLTRLEKRTRAIKPTTPYAYHYYVQALLDCNLKEKAFSVLDEYWGGMTALGADTFFECFDPGNSDKSPYSNAALNSYCHAWSCTPAFFFRKYADK